MKRAWIPGALVLLLMVGAAAAADTERWVVDSASEMLDGRGHGVAVSEDGRLHAVDRWQLGASLDEPVALAADLLDDGALVVGTGHPARLLRVRGDASEVLAEIPGEQVTSVLARPDGSVLVATMAPGVLYRWRRGELSEVARVGKGGLWDLAAFGDEVVVAAGPPATLYRLRGEGLERWIELPDAYARCLTVADGQVVVGTSGKGLVVTVDADGRTSLLVDSPFTEISDLAVGGDGSLWAVAVVGEPPPSGSTGQGSSNEESASVSSSGTDLDLPKVNGKTATSEVLRLTPEGALLSVHRFTKQVASAVVRDGDGVLVGTGFEGEVWRFVVDGGARLDTVDAVQVTAFAAGGRAVVTQGPTAVRWRRQGSEPGRYRISARHFPRPVRFGRYAVSPPGSDARIRFRSGASETSDETWLDWTSWLPAEGAVPLPAESSLQWEVELPARSDARVERVEIAFREVNLAPRLQQLEVEEPGVVYLSGPPPSGPVIDVEHPDFSGIFTVIDPTGGGNGSAQGKKYWRVGYRTVSWKAEDPNGDPLRFDLVLESSDGFRLPVRERLDASQLALDTTSVPDGRYRFHLSVSDELANPGEPMATSGTSHWFVVDNSPPRIFVQRSGDAWEVTVTDAGSALEKVEWSRDGEPWRGLAPQDGLLDGPEERFRFASESGRHLVVVRAIDRHHNRATASAVED